MVLTKRTSENRTHRVRFFPTCQKSQSCVFAALLIHLFLAVIYVIMGKNIVTRLVFRRKQAKPRRSAEPNCRKEPSEAVL